MSNEAAKILRKVSEKTKGSDNSPMLGTVKSVSPMVLQLDDVSFEITSGVLANEGLLSRSEGGSLSGTASFSGESGGISIYNAGFSFGGRLSAGDRVLVIMLDEGCFVIVCKVRKV